MVIFYKYHNLRTAYNLRTFPACSRCVDYRQTTVNVNNKFAKNNEQVNFFSISGVLRKNHP